VLHEGNLAISIQLLIARLTFYLPMTLLIIIIRLIVDHIEEPELIDTLGCGHDTQPVAELLLLEEFLRPVLISPCSQPTIIMLLQVLEISPRELGVRNDFNLALSLLRDLYSIAKVSDAAINLYLVLEELLESRDVEDLVAGGLRSVDDKLRQN
jgi:hypothetical protein